MICKNSDYQEFCSQFYNYVPVCEEIEKSILLSFPSPWNSEHETGVVLQFFELGRLLVGKKMVTFRPQGICMYPCIHPEDTLYVEPKSVGEVKVGDIAVYRRYNHLFAHRTIAKNTDEGQEYIVTRPDVALFSDDGPSYEQDILGIVTRIERKGKAFDTVKKESPFAKRIFIKFFLWQYQLTQYLWRRAVYFISRLQQSQIYEKLSRFLFKKSEKKIAFSLQAPISPKINSRFFKEFSTEELMESLKRESPFPKWRIALEVNSKPAGHLSFVLKPKECPFCGWWLYEAKVRMRYRKTRLEERFFQEAYRILRGSGIKEVFVSVLKNAHLERIIFEGMGFKKICAQKDVFLKDKNKKSFERVIMINKVI